MGMRFKATIKNDGQVVTEVLERGEHLCTEVYKVTNAVGRQMSDEETGPEGDRVEEINSGS
jgi:hypothetical protein